MNTSTESLPIEMIRYERIIDGRRVNRMTFHHFKKVYTLRDSHNVVIAQGPAGTMVEVQK